MSDIINKPEKIASAIYLVTGFFNDQEPLKWKLRSLSSELVSAGLFIKDNIFADAQSVSMEARGLSFEILSLLSVAKTAGLVSDDNHKILYDELVKYVDWLGLPPGINQENGRAILSSRFFDGTSSSSEQRIQSPSNETYKPQKLEENNIKDKSVEKPIEPTKKDLLPDVSEVNNRQENSYKPTNSTEKKTKDLKNFGAVSVKKNSRQSIIINVLKRKKEIMIKDISPLIDGCSEKTIQRELLAMVNSGILKKEGEKRWSRYSLA